MASPRRPKPAPGRPEKPLGDKNCRKAIFAAELRTLKSNAKITYRDLAARTNFSATVLSRAADGTRIPTWPVVEAYVLGCQGNVGLYQRLYYARFPERR